MKSRTLTDFCRVLVGNLNNFKFNPDSIESHLSMSEERETKKYIRPLALKISFKGSYWKGDRLRAANPAIAIEQVRGERSHV